jgi:hypothetical protein
VLRDRLIDRALALRPRRRHEADAFAALLEAGGAGRRATSAAAGSVDLDELRELSTLATALVPTQVAPSAEFRAALRERLLAEPAPAPATTASRGRTADVRHRPVRRGRRRVVAGTAAGLLAVGVGGAWASTGALPGDPLYPVKRGLEQVQLDLATSDAARGQRHLAQADHRLAEVEALLAGERADDPATAAQVVDGLAELRAADADGGRLLLADFDRTGDPEDLQVLQRALVDQRERLRDLEPRLPAAAGPAYDALLRQLGDTTTGLLQRLDRCAAACQDLSQALSRGLAASGLVTVGPDGTLRPVGAAGLSGPASGTSTSTGGTPLAGPAALPLPTALSGQGGAAAPVPSSTSSGSSGTGGAGGAAGAVGDAVTGASGAVGGTVSGVTGAVGGALDSTVGGSLGDTVSGAGSTVGGTVDSTVGSTVGGVTSTVGGLLGGSTSSPSPSPTASASPSPTSSPTSTSSPTASPSASSSPSPSPTCLVVLGVKICS